MCSIGRKLDRVIDTNFLQHLLGILNQGLKLPNVVVLHVARGTQCVHQLPMFIEALPIPLFVVNMNNEINEFPKCHVLTRFNVRFRQIRAKKFEYSRSIASLEHRIVGIKEFVSVRRQQPLKGMPHKHKRIVNITSLSTL